MFLAIIGLSMMFDLSAQKKVLTMEEAVVGYHLYPRSKYIQWQGDKNQLTYLDREGLMGESVDKGDAYRLYRTVFLFLRQVLNYPHFVSYR